MQAEPEPQVAAAARIGAGGWLLLLLIAAGAFAAFSAGAIAIPAETRLQVVISVAGLLGAAGLAVGWLRCPRAPVAWAGIALLGAFAVWSALSVNWSAAPDESWIAANRAFAYAAVAALALLAAASTRQAPVLAAIGLAAAVLLVAVYALGGKLVPGFAIGPLDLNPGDRFARLREPIEYWNALGLLCVMAAPALIVLSSWRGLARALRIGALLGLALVLLTAALTYSRGAIIAYAVALVVVVGAGPARLPRLAVGLGVPVALSPAMIVAFGRDDLSSSEVALSAREDDGLILAVVLIATLVALALAGRRLIALESRLDWTSARSHRVWRGLGLAAVAALLLGVTVLALSEPGISDRLDEFSEPQGRSGNTPERLISSNGSNRYIWWQEAAGAFSDEPLAGWGAGSFPILHYLYRRYEAPVRSAHSLPLQLLAETGVVGALLGLGGLGLLGLAGVRQLRRSEGIERSVRLALLASAGLWAVHSLYDWDWEIPAVTLPALISLGVAAVPVPSAGPRATPALGRGVATAVAAAAAATAALALAVSALLPALSEGERVDALKVAAAPAPALDEARDTARQAHDLNPLGVGPLFAQASIAIAGADLPAAVRYLEQASRTQPENWQVWVRLVGLRVQLGDRRGAREALRRASETNPLLIEPGVPSAFGSLIEVGLGPPRSPTAFGTPPP